MGGGTPRGHRMERARRPLQRCGGRRSRVYKTKPGAFPAGRTCAGSGQAEGGGARSARSSCSGPPRLRPRSSSSRALRRCAAPGRPGAGGDQCPTPYSPFWWPRGCVTAAPAWGFRAPAGSAGPEGRGSPAPEAAPEGGAEQRGVRPPGCGAEGLAHCTDAETEALGARGWHARQRGTGASASEGLFRNRGPETSPPRSQPE